MSSLRLVVRPLIVAALAVAASACGPGPDTDANSAHPVPAMRFAGVDLEYALERIAAEAGLPLALDQVRPVDNTPDLGLFRIDVDLPAGPVESALRRLQESAPGIDFEITDGVIYVRSNMLLSTKTAIDLPVIPKSMFKGTLGDLVDQIQKSIPKSYLTVERVVGDPEAPSVEFEVADKSSVKDVLIQYARASKLGWSIYRGGNVVNDPTHGVAIVGTSIQMRYPRKSTSRKPQVYSLMSTVGALATVADRFKSPMVVLDRSVLLNARGFLNLSSQKEQGLPLEESITELGESGWGPDRWHFKWHMEDGVPVIESRDFLHRLAGRDLLREELLAGEFEGSLAEFARWINTHRKARSTAVLMGGEIAEGQPRGKITIQPGTTIQQALVAFSKASRVAINVALLGNTNPLSGKLIEHPNSWHGAYIQDLSEWIPTEAELKLATGVHLPE